MTPKEVSLKHFTVSDNVLVIEGSELSAYMFCDYIPRHIVVVSHVTDRKVTFELKYERKDREGEITHWEYYPISSNTDLIEKNVKIHVYND